MAAAESDPGVIKAVAGFIAATAVAVWGWLVRRVVKRTDDHDERIKQLEVQMVQRATYEHVDGKVANVYRAIREEGKETRKSLSHLESRIYDLLSANNKGNHNEGD